MAWTQQGDADEKGRWTDESAGTGKASTKANVTSNRMGASGGRTLGDHPGSAVRFCSEESTSLQGEAISPEAGQSLCLLTSHPLLHNRGGKTRIGGGVSRISRQGSRGDGKDGGEGAVNGTRK